jgi:protein-S-isoprenylcysteine O-methyltransferase Ste14
MSLILISSFLFLAVILRVCIQRIQTGDYGVRMASPNAPLIEILPGTVFVLSFGVALVAVILNQVGTLSTVYELPNAYRWFGFVIGMTGILFTVISQYQMGDSWRIGVDSNETTSLKTGGLYAKSRNPIYFGILLFWIGLCSTQISLIVWLCAVICWVCIELIVRRIEEPYLLKTHGKPFKEYTKKTNRYLPL